METTEITKVPLPLPEYGIDETLANTTLMGNLGLFVITAVFLVVLGWMVKLALEPKHE
ncbi:hypothetical protein [Paenibacillus sp.]|jgi:hypothetical protein|uniref:hypothetical protein n=1 Tax=Paenibacillus sp. TaxID=58172 RepID=UPI0028295483|nr:hypothetical protein [Paenibacillus sp.]MDR0267967.1 hypothetical protein [Paenibacillus sp.]